PFDWNFARSCFLHQSRARCNRGQLVKIRFQLRARETKAHRSDAQSQDWDITRTEHHKHSWTQAWHEPSTRHGIERLIGFFLRHTRSPAVQTNRMAVRVVREPVRDTRLVPPLRPGLTGPRVTSINLCFAPFSQLF